MQRAVQTFELEIGNILTVNQVERGGLNIDNRTNGGRYRDL